MHKIEDIFEILSTENKNLKPDHKYKVAEEGLLRAFYFFRWINKKEFKDLDKVVDAFKRNKIPDQQIEHYGCALVMMDSYDTDSRVKDALDYINRQYKKDKGGDILETIEDPRVERRVLKNIYSVYNDSVENLKKRTSDLKSSNRNFWIILSFILGINLALLLTGLYNKILLGAIPQVLRDNPMLASIGPYALAGILFLVATLIIFFAMRYKIGEHVSNGENYLQEIERLERKVKKFQETLTGKKIKVNNHAA